METNDFELMTDQQCRQAEGTRFESHCGQECFILYFSLTLCSMLLEEAYANEINHDIHIANTLFQILVR